MTRFTFFNTLMDAIDPLLVMGAALIWIVSGAIDELD